MTDPYLSWKEPGIAERMHDLVMGELQDESHPPYKYFLRAMEAVNSYISFIPGATKLVDAGCGVGHYGHLLQKHYPNIAYRGFDFSAAMVHQARNAWPTLDFLEADAKTFDYSSYDIVLASSLIEVMDNWLDGARAMCETAKDIILLHRVRVHAAPTIRAEPEGYPGQPTYCHVHNEVELIHFFAARRFPPIWSGCWDEFAGSPFDMTTYILRRVDGIKA